MGNEIEIREFHESDLDAIVEFSLRAWDPVFTSLRDVLGFLAEFRKSDRRTPVVLFGYANPIESMGLERFADAAKAAQQLALDVSVAAGPYTK